MLFYMLGSLVAGPQDTNPWVAGDLHAAYSRHDLGLLPAVKQLGTST